jgi:hypothetical protein
LPIEAYQVSEELIEGVRSGGWTPDYSDDDRQDWISPAAQG